MLCFHNLDKHACKQIRFAWRNSRRSNAFLDIRANHLLQFCSQQSEFDPSMLDFYLSKLLKLYWRFTFNGQPIYIKIGKLQQNIIFVWWFVEKRILVFLKFNDNLLVLNQSLTFVSALLIFPNKTLMSLYEKKSSVTSVNMIVFSIFEGWCKSFTYNKNNKGSKMETWGTPHVP